MIPRLKNLSGALCSALAASALFAIMALTLVDVSGRKLLSTSVPGSLELTEGKRAEAAKLLEIGERTLFRKIKEYGLK